MSPCMLCWRSKVGASLGRLVASTVKEAIHFENTEWWLKSLAVQTAAAKGTEESVCFPTYTRSIPSPDHGLDYSKDSVHANLQLHLGAGAHNSVHGLDWIFSAKMGWAETAVDVLQGTMLTHVPALGHRHAALTSGNKIPFP